MKPGAEFRVATDIPDYMRQTLEEAPQALGALASRKTVGKVVLRP